MEQAKMKLITVIMGNACAVLAGILVGIGIRMVIDACRILRKFRKGGSK